MKNSKITPIIAVMMLVATTAPAYAFDVGSNGNINIKSEFNQQNKFESDRKTENKSRTEIERDNGFYNRIKPWIISAGTIGQVTAVNTGSITIKTTLNEIYTVTTTDAVIRRGENNNNPSAVVVGETVYIFGIKNGTNIVASTIIVGKSKDEVKPNVEEKRQAFLGVITAKTDTSITILSANNMSYFVTLASDSQVWINKNKQVNLSGFAVGDNVMVQGDLSGNNISAKKLIALHLPVGTIIGKITAINGTTLTVLGSDSKNYTVLVANADIKAKGDKGSKLSKLAIGDSVLVKGDLNGTTITAKSVTEENIKGGFFHRFGLFFKGFFGKK